jgi:Flp pilus assembly protein TadG
MESLTFGELPDMTQIALKLLRRLSLETSASEIAEAAVVLPLMFMMILGIFWFGQAFSTYGAITRAAQEGARAGAAPPCSTCTGTFPAQNAYNAVQAALTSSHLDITKIPNLAQPPVLNSCIQGQTTATCDSRVGTAVCVQTPAQFSSTVTNGGTAAGVCGVSVTFQYPFQFWLPFTSLNNQKVLLYATARVRAETR